MTFVRACQVFGLDPADVSWRIVRDLYRVLARRNHPDAVDGSRRNWDTLQEAYQALRLAFSVPQTCPMCKGAKTVPLPRFKFQPCPTCDGKGELLPQTQGPTS